MFSTEAVSGNREKSRSHSCSATVQREGGQRAPDLATCVTQAGKLFISPPPGRHTCIPHTPCLPVLPIPPLRELAPSRDTPLQGEAEQSAPLDHLFYKDWSRAGGNAENCKDCYRQNPRKCQNCCHAASATSSGASHPSRCHPCRRCEALEEPALPCTVCWGQVLTGQCGPSALGRSLLDSHPRSP